MSKVNETGHAINVANLKKLINECNSYGSKYNPSNVAIQLNTLDTLYAAADKSLDNVIQANTNFKREINNRQVVFSTVKPLSTRIINALEATDASKGTVANAKSINKKIQGTKTEKKKTDTTPTENEEMPDDKSISTSQQSYTNIREHFKNLVSIITNEPSYQPNEKEMQLNTLNSLVDAMKSANDNVNQSLITLNSARIDRNELLYNETTGIYNASKDVKKYIKSVFGPTHPYTKQIVSIKFTDKRKK